MRLREDYEEFTSRRAEVIAIGPEGPGAFARYWRSERIPFVGLPDPDHRVARTFRQEVNLFKLGRMPLVTLIDARGFVRFVHRGASMSDIPDNASLLEAIERLNASAQ